MTIDLNKGWRFCKEGGIPVETDLPHDAMLAEPRDRTCRNGVNTGYFPGGKYRYEKRFVLDKEEIGKSIVLHFEGVYQNCKVYLNGTEVGAHHYGYTAFDVDISDAVQAGENALCVTVDNSLEPNCRWYSGSGIYRAVTMHIRDRNHISGVHLETADIHPAKVEVDVITTIPCDVTVEFYDGKTLVASGAPGILEIPDAKLWSAEHPYLYRVLVKTDTDERTIPFGIRKLCWSAKTGLTVNGEKVLLRGGCIHHDHGVLGACEYPDTEERRIRILKENGFNAIRMAHNPASQITLDVCDRLGMYVMNEAFDGWYTPKTYHDYSRRFETDWKSDVTAMVESSRNHPCVIMYSIGNEVTETATSKGVEVCEKLTGVVHSLDNTRPVTAGINVLLNVYVNMGMGIYKDKGDYKPEPLPHGKAYQEKKTGSAFFNAMTQKLGKQMFFMAAGSWGDKACRDVAERLDILGLNYASSRYDPDAAKYPERMMVGAETMAADLPYNWERVKKYPQLIGDFVWAAWDYLGETCMGWTYHSYKGLPLLANQGMIDITGKPLASMAFLQVVWGLREEPFIGVRPLSHAKESPTKGSWQFTDAIDSWNWPGYEGTKAVIEVYSPGKRVRLLLNGRELGIKNLKNFKAIFRTSYAPGTLAAEALDENGKVLSTFSLSSGDREIHLRAVPEKPVLKANGTDLCHLPIEFADGTGRLLPAAEQSVEVLVEGAVSLIGMGSALYKTNESFRQNHYRTYRGRVLAVLKAGYKSGKATVTIKSAGVEPVTIHLEVE